MLNLAKIPNVVRLINTVIRNLQRTTAELCLRRSDTLLPPDLNVSLLLPKQQ